MLCTSHSPHGHPLLWGAGKFGGDTQGGWRWLGQAGMEQSGKERAGISVPASQPCIPVLGNCQPGSSPAISNVPLGPVTSRRAGEMTSRGGQQQPGAR